MDNLQKLEKLFAGAIPGAWKALTIFGSSKVISERREGSKVITQCPAMGLAPEMNLIAHARNMIPLHLSAAKALEQLVDAYDAECSPEDLHEHMRAGRNAIFHLRNDDVAQVVVDIPPPDDMQQIRDLLVERIKRLAAESPCGLIEMFRVEEDAHVAWFARADGLALATGVYNEVVEGGALFPVPGVAFPAARLEDLPLGDLALLAEGSVPDPQWSEAYRQPEILTWAEGAKPKTAKSLAP